LFAALLPQRDQHRQGVAVAEVDGVSGEVSGAGLITGLLPDPGQLA
jgi:hypothetical protein